MVADCDDDGDPAGARVAAAAVVVYARCYCWWCCVVAGVQHGDACWGHLHY